VFLINLEKDIFAMETVNGKWKAVSALGIYVNEYFDVSQLI
jgi:hypothetical protein